MDPRVAKITKIDPAWVKGIRAWVKKTFAPKAQYKSTQDILAHLRRLRDVDLNRLWEHLFYTKGLLPRDADTKSILDKLKDKLAVELKAANALLDEAMDPVSFSVEAMTPGTLGYRSRPDIREFYERINPTDPETAMRVGFEDRVKEYIPKVEAILSGKLLRAVSAFLEKYADDTPFEQDEILLKYDIGNVKLVYDGVPDPRVINRPEARTPRGLDQYIPYFQTAKALLDRRGFGKLWYGPIFVACPSCGGENPHGKQYGVGAHYVPGKDQVVVFLDPKPFMVELLIHELGHRYYYEFMNQGDRARFDSYFGDVKAVSSYGGSSPEEDFAEVFAHFVLGQDMSRDQIYRFKAFLAKADRVRLASPVLVASQAFLKLAFDTKQWGPFTFEIDRPKGFVKTWDQPDGSVKKYTYPVDYGYFVGHTGEDDEGLDAFVGDDPAGSIESFLKMKRDDGGDLIPDETKFMVGLSDSQREKVIGLYHPDEIVGLREYTDFYELLAALNAFRDRKKQARMEMTRRVVAQHLEAQDPLTALTEEVKGLEALASEIQAVVDTFLETVPMPHVGRIAAIQLRSQTECFTKCEHAARHAQRVVNKAFTILQTQPGNATATAVVRDAGMLLEKFDTYRVKSREMLSAMAQKIMPTALKTIVTYALDGVRAELYEPNRVSVTVFPHYVPTKVGDSMVDGMVFDAYLTVFPNPVDVAAGLPKYQQFVLTQSTIGDTNVYLMAIDRTNVLDPTKPAEVGAPGAVSKILGYLKGWDNLLSVHTTKMAARARKRLTREQVEAMGAAAINKWMDVLDKESSGLMDEFIAAGRGRERLQEIVRMTDPLAMRYIQNWEDSSLLRDEIARRYGPGAPSRLPRGFGPIKVAAAKAVLTRPEVVKFLVTELKKIPGAKVKSSKNSILLVPGAMNPAVVGIEILNLDLDKAPFRMTLKNGMIGWGWDAYRKPAPVFHGPHNTLNLNTLENYSNPEQALRDFVKNDILPQIGKAGMVWNGTALVPMPMGKAPAPAKTPVAPPPPAPKVDYLAAVTSALKGMRLGPVGGRILSVDYYPGASPSWSVEPSNRQRLDHYVGSGYRDRDDDGDDDDGDSEGWDSEAWEQDYADPVSTAAYKWLAAEFGPSLFYVEVGEKGHIDIQLTAEGRKKFLP